LKNIALLPESPAKQPNVLFIAIDDLRPELGCYGAPHIQSPNIDRFAESALLFNRAYCQQSVCNPSRASLLTGLRPDTTRVHDLVTNLRVQLPDVLTLPQHFKNHGYHTVAMGKIYHNTFPDPASWSIPKLKATGYRMYSQQTQETLKKLRDEARGNGMTERQISNRIRGPAVEIQDVRDHERLDGATTNLAIQQLEQLSQSGQEKPFFLAVGYLLPHLPWNPPKRYFDMYDRDTLPLADNGFLPTGSPAVAMGDRSMGGMYELRDTLYFKNAPSPFEGSLTEAEQRRLRHGYFASITYVDAMVGRLLERLNSLGLDDNTIVILWGDHGWKLGEHNSWCKQTNYEIDTRVPLIIRAPNAKANGKTTEALVEFIDIFPTLCHLAGLPIPAQLEGDNLTPLLDDPEVSIKNAAFSQFPRRHDGGQYHGYTIRTDRYRYVEWLDTDSGKTHATELYDHHHDPDENTNIATDATLHTTIQDLRYQLFQNFNISIN
jgi:arylsulfatase A-like enzyme